jgi:hypothetical protein
MQNATINNAEVINNHGCSDQSSIVDFGKYIRDNKPVWYTPNTMFDKQLLRDKYIDLYGNITKQMFHKLFVDKIFTKTVRVASQNIRIAKVLLFEYNDILDLEGEFTPFDNTQLVAMPTCKTNHNNVYIHTDRYYKTTLLSNKAKKSKWVYFIDDGTDIKIGKTINMKKRLSQLQTGNTQKLVIVAYIESDTMDQLETQFHNMLTEQHVRGEWYHLNRKKTVEMLQRYRHGQLRY